MRTLECRTMQIPDTSTPLITTIAQSNIAWRKTPDELQRERQIAVTG